MPSINRKSLLVILLVIALAAVLAMNWEVVALRPMLNILIVLYSGLAHNFGLTIVFLTIVVRLILLPLTLRQIRSTQRMQLLQPKIQEIQKKYAKDQKKLQEETSKLYSEAGVSTWGCVLPMAIQFPIWIALYQCIMRVMATNPEDLLALSQSLYSWPVVQGIVPLNQNFLWLNLAYPDSIFVLPILVAVTMWVQQKMMTSTTADPRQQQMNTMMLWMMPLMFGLFTLQFPSGLAVYWVTMNIVGIITQYFVTGWGGLRRGVAAPAGPKAIPATPDPKVVPEEAFPERKGSVDGKPGDKRQVTGGGDRSRSKKARSKQGGGRGRGSKKG